MDLGLRNKRVLITGSSSGLGFGIAEGFLAEKARVILTGRNATTLASAARKLKATYGDDRVLSVRGDLQRAATVDRLFQTVEAEWQGIDILVLNLGSGRSVPGFEATEAEWNRVLSLNLTSGMEILRRAVPLLRQGSNPSVVVIGSIAGVEALGAPIAYGAAKAALTHATKAAARLLAPAIRVNIVAPGNIFFQGGTWDRKMKENAKAVRGMLDREVPLHRLGTVEEIAAPVLFLASPRASFLTGSVLVADGGQCRGHA
jgi:3-oxoacyl-[acyl-carrier protein] reductase